MVIALYIALGLTGCLVSYHWGRRVGWRQGRRVGRAEAPVALRAQYLLEQRCPICDDERVYPILANGQQKPR